MDDFFLIDRLLSEEEKLIRDNVHKFISTEALPLLPEACDKGYFPKELIPKFAQLGLLGMYLPAQYGGSDANAVSYGLVCQELERGDSGLRSFVSVQSSLCMYPIYLYGTEEQKKKYLLPMSRAEVIGAFGLTEPDSGSDPAHMKTYAKKIPGGWQLQGSKMWITNATIADIAIVWAQTEQGIRGFIVPTDTKGVQRNEIKNKMSLRVSITGELVFDGCKLADDALLPGTEIGLQAALSCLTQARYGVACGATGAAMACYDTALEYTKSRIQFDKPIAAYQLIQKDLVEMLNEITKAQLLTLQLGRFKDRGLASPVMVSLAKMNNCKEALKIARMARNLLGANGISLEYPVIRHMTNLESVYTYEGTDNIHHLIIGRHITGLNAFN